MISTSPPTLSHLISFLVIYGGDPIATPPINMFVECDEQIHLWKACQASTRNMAAAQTPPRTSCPHASSSFQSQLRERSNLLIHVNLPHSFELLQLHIKSSLSSRLCSQLSQMCVARSPAAHAGAVTVKFMDEEDWEIIKLDPTQFWARCRLFGRASSSWSREMRRLIGGMCVSKALRGGWRRCIS